MKLETRRATDSDCELLSQLCFRSKRSNGYDSAFMEACRVELTVTPATLARSECWIAHSNQALCGCGCLTIDREQPADKIDQSEKRSGEITLFFIDPDWQRRRVGTMIWKILLQRARHYHLDELMLDADPSAQGFYESLGFTVVGQSASGSIPGRYLPKMRLTNF